MPRAKDAKVWNEDLVTALRSREERCRQQFSQRQYLWRDGAAAIVSVRKDIYQYKNGRIVGLPKTLKTSVEEECRAIIEGRRPVLAEGYVPTTLDEKLSNDRTILKMNNPYHNDPYLKRIKMRGGAYAILMAFHDSLSKTMTQKQICTAAQRFCDEEMEANFYSGRSYGAWSSKKTLIKHGLIKESRTTQMGRHGQVCNGVFEYSLTENGRQFLDALITKFPQTSNIINNQSGKNRRDGVSLCFVQSRVECRENGNGNEARKSMGTVRRTKKKIAIEDWLSMSDSEEDEESFDNLGFHMRRHKTHQIEDKILRPSPDTGVIDLLESSDEESDFLPPRQCKMKTKLTGNNHFPLGSCENVPNNASSFETAKQSITSQPKLIIIIDDRERNRNATPRQMRLELNRHLSERSGSLRQVWPTNVPVGEIEEEQLNYGDFAFVLKCEGTGMNQRLPLSIERKRISDLVQRSAQSHHWQQLHRMRDCCEHAILLIEGNTKKTSNFVSYEGVEFEDSWNPDNHAIDDEHAFYRFLGRAILSSPILKILQTPHEQASYRSIGTVGLTASLLQWKTEAPKHVPTTKMSLNKLYNKLKSRGIPWQISRRLSEELGSIKQLDQIYTKCEASSRASVLVPLIYHACSGMIETENSRSILEYGAVETWSSAIHSAWYSRLSDPSEASHIYEENKFFSNDRAQLLTALHRGKSVDRAIRESNIYNGDIFADASYSRRKVEIRCSSNFKEVFPSDLESDTFYQTTLDEENPLGLILPSVVMQTNNGVFESTKLVICIIEGIDLLERVQESVVGQSFDELYEVSQAVAKRIASECSSFLKNEKMDRTVLLIRSLGSALASAAKQSTYRAEYRVLVDLVIADLMLQNNIVVIQAPRLVKDLETILRELAMACFYYQLTTRKLR